MFLTKHGNLRTLISTRLQPQIKRLRLLVLESESGRSASSNGSETSIGFGTPGQNWCDGAGGEGRAGIWQDRMWAALNLAQKRVPSPMGRTTGPLI